MIDTFQKLLQLIILTVVFLLIRIDHNAQVIQLGAGSSSTTITSSSPVNIWYRRAVMQFVYTASELNVAGASSNNPITKLGFYITSNPIYNLPGYTIKIKHVPATDVSSALGTTGWTTVKNAFTYSPITGGYDMQILDTPFLWDGVSNIGVEICHSRVNPGYNSSGTCRYYASTNGFRYSRTDAGGTSCGSTPNIVNTFKPQIQLIFAEESIWTGNVNTDWFNNLNWSAGVPTELMNATIPIGLTNYPIISSLGAVCLDLEVTANASLTIVDNNEIDVNGNWTCFGNFTPNNSTVILSGTSNSILTGTTQQFHNIRNINPQGITFSTGLYQIGGALYPEGGPITTNNLITILSNSFGTGRITEIKTICEYTLNMTDTYGDSWNGGFLEVLEDGISLGTFFASGNSSIKSINVAKGSNVELIYNSGAYENENAYSLSDPNGTIIFSDGVNPSTGSVFTFTSTCSSFTDPFVGDINLQRYISANVDGWRELASPVASSNLSDWENDGLVMSGFMGSNYPNFGWISAYTYNENDANGVKEDGWLPATNITNVTGYSNGHRIYVGSGSYTLELGGDVNAGEYNYNLKYQNILPSEITADENQKGWNLIGNPMPCAIAWDNIDGSRKNNVEDAIWIWSADAGNYGIYVGGSTGGTNGVDNNVASHQSFWVHADNSSASITINESDKIDFDQPFVKSNNSAEFTKIKISSSINGYSDELGLVFNNSSLPTFDNKDGLKLFSPINQAPSLSGKIGNNRISINASNFGDPIYLPVYADVGVSGNYQLTCPQHILSDSLSCLYIEDIVEGTFTAIDTSMIYNFYQNSSDTSARFVIHYVPKVLFSSLNPLCSGMNNGSIMIQSNNSFLNSFLFEDILAGTIDSLNNIGNIHTISNLTPGNYSIQQITNSALCSSNFINISIENPEPIIVDSLTTNPTSCNGCNDGNVQLFVSGGTPPYQYFLDGHIDLLDSLSPGILQIKIVDQNGCSEIIQTIIEDENYLGDSNIFQINFSFYPNPANDFLKVKFTTSNNQHLLILNTQGQIVYENSNYISESSINLKELSNGLYFLHIKGLPAQKVIINH